MSPRTGGSRFPYGQLLILPALIMMIAFILLPIIWGIVVSFTDMSLVGPRAMKLNFVGLKNYLKLLGDADFYNSLRVSFFFTLFSALLGQAFLGLFLAILMRQEGLRGKTLAALAVFVSWVIPEVVAGYMWGVYASKRGLFCDMLSLLGFKPRNLLITNPLEMIIIANIWRGTAFSMILFSAALESIPNYIYEAAHVDGASAYQRFRYITFPLVSRALLVDFVLITIWTFSVFTMVFVMTGGGPAGKTELWTIFAYRRSLQPPYEVGYAVASTNLMALLVLVLVLLYMRMMKRIEVRGV